MSLLENIYLTVLFLLNEIMHKTILEVCLPNLLGSL